MAKYTLKRRDNGALIETDSATYANDLVAHGVATRVAPTPSRPAPTVAPVRRKSSDTNDN